VAQVAIHSSTSVRCDEACAAAMLELSDGSDLALRTQSYDVKRMIKSLRAIPPAIEEKARVSGTLQSRAAIQRQNVPDFLGTQYMGDANIAAMMEQHEHTKGHEFTPEVTLDEVLNSNRLMKKELEGILQQLNETVPDKVEWAKQAMEVGAGFAMTGDGKKAKEILQQCMSSLSGRYGAESEPAAKVHSRMAAAHYSLGEYSDQKRALERAVGVWRKAAKPDVTEFYLALTDLSGACGALGLAEQQTQLSEEASQLLETSKTQVDDVTRARGLTNAAAACGDAGKPEEKKELLEKALATLGSTRLPISDVEIGLVLENLGAAHGELGDPISKLMCQQRAVHLVKRHYGTDHVQYARAAANLGATYGELGDHLRQRSLLQAAYKVMEAHYGAQHVDVATTAEMLSAAKMEEEEEA